ncbi:hypothetical protein VOLCADRAFT_119468 [Volvox carteri f. nagariensis]|uniref:Uncharacterized protein n=1 Tax=Volvox carteri f. nagariensis TaxID=3068 RepID=D8UDB4_VOLCA|nr:uncharacterized protein VOLCADRAFT_119468 [Volvox carteri f. nagariensis]EFJ42280.1 hypothetical protein VOLCADRAFT_119468 [Volvox carteri f. nagariensis]|eukprot:XP_002956678.1 hypothetical protein VOLCADRAFT_119468 [Volvox carteri f. nagariensis]
MACNFRLTISVFMAYASQAEPRARVGDGSRDVPASLRCRKAVRKAADETEKLAPRPPARECGLVRQMQQGPEFTRADTLPEFTGILKP